MKKIILIFIGVFSIAFSAKAQDFQNILLADSGDANKLLKAYLDPGMKGFIYGMNSGWYHTAKVHKKFGFDFSFGLSGTVAPTKDEVFNIASLGLTSISSNATTAATLAGEDTSTSMTVTTTQTVNGVSQNVTANFDFPGGIKGKAPLGVSMAVPFAQLNVGLPFKMDGMLRIVPKVGIGSNGNVDLLGLGLKKEITSWFGPLDKLPLHVSLLAAYSKLNVEYGFDDSSTGNLHVNNGLAKFALSSYTVEAIGSLNFPFINVYGGFGYSSGSSNFKMTGTYTGVYDTNLPNPAPQTVTKSLTPPDLDFSASGFKTTVGARLSLGFFKVFAAYTMQEYSAINAGIAISIR